MPSRQATRTARRRSAARPRRAHVVWGTLLATMTAVGGLLYALDKPRSAGNQGVSLPALLAPAASSSIEGVLATRTPLDTSRWQGIVIHHTASPYATPQTLEAQAKDQKLQGLGYHFVIGNGSGMDDGEVHVGYRWLAQLPGAHTAGDKADWYNRHAIGICLVGNGDREAFTDAQMRRLVQLVRTLADELKIPRERIVLHRDLANTTSPGRLFAAASFREQINAR